MAFRCNTIYPLIACKSFLHLMGSRLCPMGAGTANRTQLLVESAEPQTTNGDPVPDTSVRRRGVSRNPAVYIAAAAALRHEADQWDGRPERKLGGGPVEIAKNQKAEEPWKVLAWNQLSACNIALVRKRIDPSTAISQLRATADAWEQQASYSLAADLSDSESEHVNAIANNTPLAVTPDLSAPLASLETMLLEKAPDNLFVLGGGSVLAMRYDHRRSTDLDLFYPAERIATVASFARRGLWEDTFSHMLSTPPDIAGASGAIGGTPATIFATSDLPRDRVDQPIEAFRTNAQATRHILHGKLLRTSEGPKDLTIRDLYDITIAARLEPDATAQALAKVRVISGHSAKIVTNLNAVPDDLYLQDPNGITEARYDLDLHALGKRLVPLIETGDPGRAPHTQRLDTPHRRSVERQGPTR